MESLRFSGSSMNTLINKTDPNFVDLNPVLSKEKGNFYGKKEVSVS